MPTRIITPTGFDANSGWTGTATDMNVSNDTRVTGGVLGDTFDAALDSAGPGFGPTNSAIIGVEARIVGTVERPKQLVLDLKNSVGTILGTLTTPDITATDSTSISSSITITDDSAGDVNGYYISASITEGGGMPDTASIEIDYLYVEIDYDPPPQSVTDTYLTNTNTIYAAGYAIDFTLTDTYLNDATDTFYGEYFTMFATDTFIDESTNTLYAETALATYDVTDTFLDDSATDAFYGETINTTYGVSEVYFINSNTLYAETSLATYDVTDTVISDGDTLYAETSLATYDVTPSIFNNSNAFYLDSADVSLVETTRVIIIT